MAKAFQPMYCISLTLTYKDKDPNSTELYNNTHKKYFNVQFDSG